jgi:hypothetical protein
MRQLPERAKFNSAGILKQVLPGSGFGRFFGQRYGLRKQLNKGENEKDIRENDG